MEVIQFKDMKIISMKLCVVLPLLFLMINGTAQKEAEEPGLTMSNSEGKNPIINNSEKKKMNEKQLDITEVDKQEPEENESSKEENGNQKPKKGDENLKPGGKESTKKDTQLPIQLEDDVFQEFGSFFLSKLDGELKKKVQSKIEDEKLSISTSLFEEFTEEEKEKLKNAMSEAFSPLLAKIVEQFATGGIHQDVFSISPSAVSNLSLEQNEEKVTLDEKDEL